MQQSSEPQGRVALAEFLFVPAGHAWLPSSWTCARPHVGGLQDPNERRPPLPPG